MPVDQLKKIIDDAVTVANAGDRLTSTDFAAAIQELKSIDEAGANALADALVKLDLKNDNLEYKVEEIGLVIFKYAPLIVRLLGIFLPKKP